MDQRLPDPAGVGPVDWRGLCQDLLDEVLARPLIPDRALIDRARAVLAEPEPEAVGPTDEELKALAGEHSWDDPNDWIDYLAFARAVLARFGHHFPGVTKMVGQPAPQAEEKLSDEDCWQWYTYCPEEGLEIYSDREQAQSAAQSIMGSYEVAAYSDGWHEDMESVSWGMLVPVEQAEVVERKTAEPGGEFDEWVKYELRPARYGHQPAPPAEGGVGELVAWLRENAEDERQMCESSNRASLNLDRAADLLEHLAGWKESALAVEREWDAHGIATMLGCKLGESQRACIQREVPRLLDQLRELEQRHPAPVPVSVEREDAND